MGCFSWIFRKKKKKKDKKRNRKDSGKHTKDASPRADGIANMKTATGGVAFDIGITPARRTLPPIRHKCAESLKSAEEKALLADTRRMEEMVKKGEAAKEAARRREIYLEQKAEQEQQFVEKARQTMANKVLPTQEEIKANMKSLDKRCKTARTRKKVKKAKKALRLFSDDKGCGEGAPVAPSSSFN